MRDETLAPLITSVTMTIKMLIETPEKLQTFMASALISEFMNRKDRETPISQDQIKEKIKELFERFSGIIRSLGLETAVNSPEKKINFILDASQFPTSHNDLMKDVDGSFKAILVTLRKDNLPSSTPFAGVVGLAGAGSAARPRSASGSSTDASPGASPATGVV